MTKSIKKNTVFNAIKTVSAIIFPLITFPYASRTLLVENIGKVNFGLSFISYFSLIASLGINVYAIRECAKFSNDRVKLSKIASEIFSINVFTTIFSYSILILCLVFYKKIENYRILIVIQSMTIVFTTLGTDWLNTAMEDFQYITIRSLLFQVLSLILLFAFIHKPDDYIKYAAISVISSSGYNIVNMIYRKKYCDIKFTLDIDIKKHYLPIIFLFVMLLSQTIFNNVDMTMLGVMKGDYSVGIYSTAHKISNVINQVVASILWVVIPRISYYFGKNDFIEINKLLRKILGFNITLGLPCAIGTILMSTDIIRLIAGEEFIQSSIVLRILMVSFFISLFGGSFLGNIVLLSMNREKYYMIICLVCGFVNVTLNYFFIQKYNYIGAAITTMFCSLLIFIMALLKIDNRIRINNIVGLFIQPMIGCILITIICINCYKIDNYILRICLAIPISFVVYFSIQVILKNDLCTEFVKSIIRKIPHVKF